jgi:hypothetical protein
MIDPGLAIISHKLALIETSGERGALECPRIVSTDVDVQCCKI